MGSAAPDLERADADVAAATQAADALAAETADTVAAIEAAERRHERLQKELPVVRAQAAQQAAQLRAQQAKLAEMEAAAIKAQQEREATQAAAAAAEAAKTASCGIPPDAAASLLEMLSARLAGTCNVVQRRRNPVAGGAAVPLTLPATVVSACCGLSEWISDLGVCLPAAGVLSCSCRRNTACARA
jgi:hypothetical protein